MRFEVALAPEEVRRRIETASASDHGEPLYAFLVMGGFYEIYLIPKPRSILHPYARVSVEEAGSGSILLVRSRGGGLPCAALFLALAVGFAAYPIPEGADRAVFGLAFLIAAAAFGIAWLSVSGMRVIRARLLGLFREDRPAA